MGKKVFDIFPLEHQNKKSVKIPKDLAGGLGKSTQLLYGKEFHCSEQLKLFD